MIAFCAIVTTTFLPPSIIPPTHPTLLSGLRSLDWLGTLLLIGSTTSLILGFSFHTSFLQPWSAPLVWGNLVGAVIGLAIFVWWEGRVERPVVPLGLLKSKHRGAIMASGFFLSVGNQAFVSYANHSKLLLMTDVDVPNTSLFLGYCEYING
jgi:hypothetical protein